MPSSKALNISSSILNRRIAIQQPIDTPDGSGGFVRSFQTIAGCESVPCAVTILPPSKKGDEVVNAQQVYATRMQQFTIRYMPSINISDAMQVVYGTRIYNIRAITNPDEGDYSIQIQAEELQAKGSTH